MKAKLTAALAGLAMLAGAGAAHAEGELNLYNWGNYTSPDMIKKFEEKYKVKPSANYMPIWINEGLLLESRPDQMENFKNVDERWVNVDWDPGRKFSVPWQWGLTGIIVDTGVYKGDINTAAIFLDPPAELVGKINVTPEMNDVLYTTIRYMGGQWCTTDKEVLKKVRDKLVEAKPK